MVRGRISTSEEAAGDALVLADSLGWDRFAFVGHSMSALVALHLAQHHADRIDRAVVLAPPPPTGFGADDASIAASRSLALADAATQLSLLERWFGTRLSPGWTPYKASRWRACADPAAVAAYVTMFARGGLPDPTARIIIPLLAITGEQDAPPIRREAVSQALGPLCDHLVIPPPCRLWSLPHAGDAAADRRAYGALSRGLTAGSEQSHPLSVHRM
jgi:pimeloyl-ACP methyl ester carboxylesterase